MKADLVVRNGHVVPSEETFKGGIAITDGKFVAIGTDDSLPDGKEVIDARGKHILPGLIDAHVHFREPGLTYKEDFGTGSTAAVCGGITTVVDMPNVIPPTADGDEVRGNERLAEDEPQGYFCLLVVVVQTNPPPIVTMASRGATGSTISFG